MNGSSCSPPGRPVTAAALNRLSNPRCYQAPQGHHDGGDFMEGDTIRASGTNTLVDLWLVDRVRPICVTREAIAANVGFAKAEGMGEDERCQFVRSNLSLILKAARTALDDSDHTGELVVLDGSALVAGASVGGERRKDDRRKVERRKAPRQKAGLAHPDRRRSERRQSERRRQPRAKEQK